MRIRRLDGPTFAAWDWTFTPVAGRLELQVPGLAATCTVPLACRAAHPDGRREIHPVVDLTRVAQGAALLAGVLVARRLALRAHGALGGEAADHGGRSGVAARRPGARPTSKQGRRSPQRAATRRLE